MIYFHAHSRLKFSAQLWRGHSPTEPAASQSLEVWIHWVGWLQNLWRYTRKYPSALRGQTGAPSCGRRHRMFPVKHSTILLSALSAVWRSKSIWLKTNKKAKTQVHENANNCAWQVSIKAFTDAGWQATKLDLQRLSAWMQISMNLGENLGKEYPQCCYALRMFWDTSKSVPKDHCPKDVHLGLQYVAVVKHKMYKPQVGSVEVWGTAILCPVCPVISCFCPIAFVLQGRLLGFFSMNQRSLPRFAKPLACQVVIPFSRNQLIKHLSTHSIFTSKCLKHSPLPLQALPRFLF